MVVADYVREALKSGEDSNRVIKGLHAIRDFNGVSGIKQFEEDVGWPIVDRRYLLRTLRNGEYVNLN